MNPKNRQAGSPRGGQGEECWRIAGKIWRKSADLVLDLLFPRRCPVCDRVVPMGELICPECEKGVNYIKGAVCAKCGKMLEDKTAEYCHDCGRQRHSFERGRAVFDYRSMAGSIYRFKYGGRQEYAEYYGTRMAQQLGRWLVSLEPGALVPVPIHPARKRKRGYNQAELIARVLGGRLGIPVRTDLIERRVNTVPQKELDGSARQNNLKRAFKICGNDVKLSTIVIIDDIYTTGSTVDAMALELKTAGVERVYFAALAIGKGL